MNDMKTQENLVWDKHTEEPTYYVDFGDIELNYATLSTIVNKVNQITSHMMSFFKFALSSTHLNSIFLILELKIY